MRKLKKLKGRTRRKVGYVDLGDDIIIPIKTLSVAEEIEFDFGKYFDVPTIQRRANQEEIEEIKANDPSYNSKIIPFIKIYDKTSEEFAANTTERTKLEQIATVIKYIDMDYLIDGEISMWEDFEIEKGDYYELSKYFAYEFGLTNKDLEVILLEVKALQGESVYEKLAKFEQMTNQGMLKILNYVYDGIERDNELMKDAIGKGMSAMEDAEKLNAEYKEEETEV